MKFKALIVLFFIVLVVIFSLQNSEMIEVKFLFWKLSMSRVLIILGSFFIGLFVGILVSLKRKKPLHSRNHVNI
jgi:putative membrane protein